MNVGITGHRKLKKPEYWGWVGEELGKLITRFSKDAGQLTAISSLAIGADQLFADLVIKSGGSLCAVIPFPDYRRDFSGDEIKEYDRLLRDARSVETMEAMSTPEESYLAAGKRVVDLSNVMFTIWDGEKAAGLGGTGDVVGYAKRVRKQIIHLNPYKRMTQVIEPEGI